MVRVSVASSWQGSANQVCLAARTAKNGNRRHPLNRHDVGHCRTLPRPGGGFFLADSALVRPGGFPYIHSAPSFWEPKWAYFELSCTELREPSSAKLPEAEEFWGIVQR